MRGNSKCMCLNNGSMALMDSLHAPHWHPHNRMKFMLKFADDSGYVHMHDPGRARYISDMLPLPGPGPGPGPELIFHE
jgi:hypothetical protein